MKLRVPDTSLMKVGETVHTHAEEGVLQVFTITKITSKTVIEVQPQACACKKGKRHGSVQ